MDDIELVSLVIQKDPAAEDIFMETFERIVTSALYKKWGEASSDYKQQAWLGIFDHLEEFKDWRGSLASFVYQHAWWSVGNYRGDKSVPAQESLTQEEDDPEWSPSDHTGWLEWREQDFCDAVPGVIDFNNTLLRTQKSTRNRSIYLLVKIFGMSCSQVASHYKIDIGTVFKIVGKTGHKSTRDLQFITNGTINQMISIEKEPEPGFWKGRTSTPRLKDPVTGKFTKATSLT